jgi:hypothetical protein
VKRVPIERRSFPALDHGFCFVGYRKRIVAFRSTRRSHWSSVLGTTKRNKIKSADMKLLLALIGSVLLLAVASFCLFGFLATFEPTDRTVQFWVFRIGYAVVGLGSIAGTIALIVNAFRK